MRWTYRVEDMKDIGCESKREVPVIIMRDGKDYAFAPSVELARRLCAEQPKGAA